MRYRALLAYDGAAYQGFQRQREGVPTIQQTVENAIASITQQRATVIGAGRTDTGVHASGQVIAFDVEWTHGTHTLLRALNAVLPPDIAIQDIAEAAADFHPRFSASARQYRYSVLSVPQRHPLLRNRVWHVHEPLEQGKMQTAAKLLLGEHDFAAFGKAPDEGESTIRALFVSEWLSAPPLLEYVVKANAFLQHMVRRIVGALVDVGRGRLTLAQFEDIFRRADSADFKTLAPPQGLVLEAVFYPDDKLLK